MFAKLYELIKKKDSLFQELLDEGKEFLKRKEDEIYESLKLNDPDAKKSPIEYKHPDVSIKPNLICYNKCHYCPNTHSGEVLDLELTIPFLKNVKGVYLTGGGDPLLQPSDNLENFLNKYAELNNNSYLEIMTSGITPNAPNEMKQRYYKNLETLYLLGNELFISVCFTYSKGDEPTQRLTDFLNHYKYLLMYHHNYGYFDVNYKILVKNEKECVEKLSKFTELIDVYYGEGLKYSAIVNKEDVKTINFYKKCDNVSNSLFIDTFGNISPCCSIFADFKPLPVIPFINESLEEINTKRFVYYGLINSFQESYKKWEKKNSKNNISIHDHCTICVNEFPKFLQKVTTKLEKNEI
jgi:hypothetical protein